MIELLAALAVARVSVFIVRERAPFKLMERLRTLAGLKPDEMGVVIPTNELAYLLSCVWCISIWLGFLATFLLHQPWYYGLAYSAVAIFYDEKL